MKLNRAPADVPTATRLSWRGVALLFAVCLVNGVRRNIGSQALQSDLSAWLADIGYATVSGLMVGVPVVMAVIVAVDVKPARHWLRYPVTIGAALIASAAGSLILLGRETEWTWASDPASRQLPLLGMFLFTWPRYALLASLFGFVHLYLRESRDRERALGALEADRARFEQRTAEAKLQRLQAQIEPHFLFNTLAHVKRLYRIDAATGRTMLENLMRYLDQALPQMREARSTVAREAALTQAYLSIQKIRMGQRLEFSVEVASDVAQASLPPMMLVTLAENSIKHGLTPLREGGGVHIRAWRDGNRLVVRVADSGRGFVADAGAGTGLANLAARLTGLYGQGATLRLTESAPRGVTATLDLPLRIDVGMPSP